MKGLFIKIGQYSQIKELLTKLEDLELQTP